MSKNPNISPEQLILMKKIFISSERLDGISMKFSEKMCLMIILNVIKNQSFTLSLENTISEKQGGQIEPNVV